MASGDSFSDWESVGAPSEDNSAWTVASRIARDEGAVVELPPGGIPTASAEDRSSSPTSASVAGSAGTLEVAPPSRSSSAGSGRAGSSFGIPVNETFQIPLTVFLAPPELPPAFRDDDGSDSSWSRVTPAAPTGLPSTDGEPPSKDGEVTSTGEVDPVAVRVAPSSHFGSQGSAFLRAPQLHPPAIVRADKSSSCGKGFGRGSSVDEGEGANEGEGTVEGACKDKGAGEGKFADRGKGTDELKGEGKGVAESEGSWRARRPRRRLPAIPLRGDESASLRRLPAIYERRSRGDKAASLFVDNFDAVRLDSGSWATRCRRCTYHNPPGAEACECCDFIFRSSATASDELIALALQQEEGGGGFRESEYRFNDPPHFVVGDVRRECDSGGRGVDLAHRVNSFLSSVLPPAGWRMLEYGDLLGLARPFVRAIAAAGGKPSLAYTATLSDNATLNEIRTEGFGHEATKFAHSADSAFNLQFPKLEQEDVLHPVKKCCWIVAIERPERDPWNFGRPVLALPLVRFHSYLRRTDVVHLVFDGLSEILYHHFGVGLTYAKSEEFHFC